MKHHRHDSLWAFVAVFLVVIANLAILAAAVAAASLIVRSVFL